MIKTEQTSDNPQIGNSSLGVVSGSSDFLSEQLPIIEWNDYEY